MDFRAALRETRTAAGLTQTALAHRVGLSRPTIHNYEAGKTYPSPDIYRSLIDVLGPLPCPWCACGS